MTPQLARKGNEPTAKMAVEAKGPSPSRDPFDPLDYQFFPRQVAASGRRTEFFTVYALRNKSCAIAWLVSPLLYKYIHNEHQFE